MCVHINDVIYVFLAPGLTPSSPLPRVAMLCHPGIHGRQSEGLLSPFISSLITQQSIRGAFPDHPPKIAVPHHLSPCPAPSSEHLSTPQMFTYSSIRFCLSFPRLLALCEVDFCLNCNIPSTENRASYSKYIC